MVKINAETVLDRVQERKEKINVKANDLDSATPVRHCEHMSVDLRPFIQRYFDLRGLTHAPWSEKARALGVAQTTLYQYMTAPEKGLSADIFVEILAKLGGDINQALPTIRKSSGSALLLNNGATPGVDDLHKQVVLDPLALAAERDRLEQENKELREQLEKAHRRLQAIRDALNPNIGRHL